MFRRIFISIVFFALFPITVFSSHLNFLGESLSKDVLTVFAQPFGIIFKPGDTAHYNINMGFISGSMDMTVDSVGDEGVWIHQIMNLGFLGNQDVKLLIDPNTGEIKKYIVNGKEQTPPKKGNIEVVDSKEDTITVPAGTITCLYIKAIDRDQNQEVEQWINPKIVPVFGIVKSIAPSNFGKVTIELVSYRRT